MREIEIKVRVAKPQQALAAIAQKGIQLSAPVKHHDVVFCKPGQKDYEPGSVWLRIRTENDKTVIFTLKADTGRKLDSIEHEVTVSSGEELEAMLKLLGMELYSDLTKTRRKAKFGSIELCFDEVDGLGTYVEAEALVADHQADAAPVKRKLWDFLQSLGLTPADEETLGYDVLIKRLHR